MAKKIDVRELDDEPVPPPIKPKGLREFRGKEWADRREKRRQGELKDPPVELLTADSNRARQRIYVTLHPDAVTIARRLGNGVVSRGIDRALFEFKSTKRRKKHVKEKTETTT